MEILPGQPADQYAVAKATPTASPTATPTPAASAVVSIANRAEAQSASPIVPSPGSPRFFAASPGSLQKAKARLAAGDRTLAPALKELLLSADKALRDTPPSVTEKKTPAPSKDPHDYASLAPYFWPDPQKPNGLPYIRHDGKVNPESKEPEFNDSPRLGRMSKCVETLALAYYFTGKEAYAEKAAKFLRTWFLDPATRMNPSMNFAQAIRGLNNGRDTGLLEARNIADAADALGLIEDSRSWSKKDKQEMSEWLGTFFNWLMTSEMGKGEHAAKNNHGTWFDVQSATLALCLGHTEEAARIVKDAEHARVSLQIKNDGTQPMELARTAAFSYSCFNLDALTELATLGEYAGVDLWNYSEGQKRGIRGAIEFMLPYVDVPPKEWPYQQIKDKKEDMYLPILHKAGIAYRDPKFDAIVAKYPNAGAMRFQLLFLK